MATINQTKVISYILVLPSPRTPSPPLSEPQAQKDQNNRKRNDKTGISILNCNCVSALLGGLCLATLLAISIALPLTLTLLITNTEASSTASTTVVPTTTIPMTVTDTTTSTTTITSTSTSSTSTVTATTTELPCSPTCTSQQTCSNGICVGIGYLSCTLMWSRAGDGDIVVATPNNNIIYYSNRGPGTGTDQGQLDVDNKNGTGPENVFWSNSSFVPPTGTYYVCFSQFSFTPTANSTKPITATVKVVRSTNSTLTFTKSFTSIYKDYSKCDATSYNLLGSFSYP